MPPVRADYRMDRVTDNAVFITDLNQGGMSVTNDADAVVAEIFVDFGNKRIFYVDSDNNHDELVHHLGRFHTFKSGWPDDGEV